MEEALADLTTTDPQSITFEAAPDFDAVKQAIYGRMQELHDAGIAITRLVLSPDIYEILNTRLVFKTAAHKELPHLITPYGNLLVPAPASDEKATIRFQ